MYIQLTKESSHEKYDERRVNFLKAQMIQLERQILLLNEALGGRMGVLLEAENALQIIMEHCRSVNVSENCCKYGGNHSTNLAWQAICKAPYQ